MRVDCTAFNLYSSDLNTSDYHRFRVLFNRSAVNHSSKMQKKIRKWLYFTYITKNRQVVIAMAFGKQKTALIIIPEYKECINTPIIKRYCYINMYTIYRIVGIKCFTCDVLRWWQNQFDNFSLSYKKYKHTTEGFFFYI